MLRWWAGLRLNGHLCDDVAVAVENKVYSFGGSRSKKDEMDVRVFNTVSLRWREMEGDDHSDTTSPGVFGHSAVLIEDIIYIWGGWPYCNVLSGFDVDAHRWSRQRVSGTVPEERGYHSACALGKVMYVHGGLNKQYIYSNDMYQLDTPTMVWSLINTRGPAPHCSAGHSATIIGTKMFVFGGMVPSNNNIRVFDTETNQWQGTPSAQLLPEGRWRHSAFTYDGELFIFCGCNNNQYCNDLWKVDPELFSWKKVEPKGKGPGPMYVSCSCMVGDRVVVYCITNDRKAFDLCVLDLSPSLKTLCKLAVIQYRLEQSELPHDIRWELAAMTQQQKNHTCVK